MNGKKSGRQEQIKGKFWNPLCRLYYWFERGTDYKRERDGVTQQSKHRWATKLTLFCACLLHQALHVKDLADNIATSMNINEWDEIKMIPNTSIQNPNF